MGIRGKIAIKIGGNLWMLVQIGGGVIHIWTTIIAYGFSGIFAAAITFLIPFGSDLYWFVKIGSRYGYGHQYCIAIMVIVVVSIFCFLIGLWGHKDEDFK